MLCFSRESRNEGEVAVLYFILGEEREDEEDREDREDQEDEEDKEDSEDCRKPVEATLGHHMRTWSAHDTQMHR